MDNSKQLESKVLFGAEVQYFRLEPKVWRTVLERLKESGLETVSFYVPWEVHEVEPPSGQCREGHYDFDGHTAPHRNLTGFLNLIQELGLRANVRPGPFCCAEMAWGGYPRRMVMEHPEIMVWDWQNRTQQGYWINRREGSQPSYLHPAYLEEVKHWFEAVDKIFRDFLPIKGGPICMLNLDNEVSYICKDGMFDSDYNPVVVGEGGIYHQWLGQKYGNASNLPYTQRYKNITEVVPPRELGDDLEENLLYYFDWIEFKEWILAEYIKRLREMHIQNGIAGIQFYTNLNPHRPDGVPANFKKFYEASSGLIGYDFYRGTFLSYSGYSSMARILKLLDAVVPTVWSAEFMAGTWKEDLSGSRVPKSHTEFMSLAALSHGCKGISYYMFHDREMWGDAPLSNLGHPRENLEAIKTVTSLVKSIPEWDNLRVCYDCAVAYYRPYHWHTHLGDPNPCADNTVHTGTPLLFGVEAGRATLEYEGIFRILQQAGYTAGIVDLTDAPERLSEFRLLWLPNEPFIDKHTAERLKDFVHKGGCLITAPYLPKRDLAGKSLKTLSLLQENVLKTSTALGTIKYSRMGAGMIVWIEKYIAQNPPGQEPLETIDEVKSLLARLGFLPRLSVKVTPVVSNLPKKGGGLEKVEEKHSLCEAVIQSDGKQSYLFLNNLYLRAVEVKLSFKKESIDSLRDVLTGQRYPAGNHRDITVDIDRKSSRVFIIEKKQGMMNSGKVSAEK